MLNRSYYSRNYASYASLYIIQLTINCLNYTRRGSSYSKENKFSHDHFQISESTHSTTTSTSQSLKLTEGLESLRVHQPLGRKPTHSEEPHNLNHRTVKPETQSVPTSAPEGPPEWRPLSKSDMDNVQLFLFFVGWPRSCHSIVGSMLDAHPNMVVAHEFFLFQNLDKTPSLKNRTILYNNLYKNSYTAANTGWRTSMKVEKGYTLSMDGWQGRFTKLRVIGDKSGGYTALMYQTSSNKFKSLYNWLKAEVKVPIKVIHVIRNPFDMIATATLYTASSVRGISQKVKASPSHKYVGFGYLRQSTNVVLQYADAINRMLPDVGLSPHQVYCEDLIADPIGTISSICQYLEVDCSEDYLQMCADKTYKNASVSRDLVEWDPATFNRVTNSIKRYSFFNRYTFQ